MCLGNWGIARPAGNRLHSLNDDFLFESSSQSLFHIQTGLRKISSKCFYCGSSVTDADVNLDHFIPHFLYPRNLAHHLNRHKKSKHAHKPALVRCRLNRAKALHKARNFWQVENQATMPAASSRGCSLLQMVSTEALSCNDLILSTVFCASILVAKGPTRTRMRLPSFVWAIWV